MEVPSLASLERSVRPAGRWTKHTLLAAIQLALTRGWPAPLIAPALLVIASDPETRSPVRLAEAGPWWDTHPVRPEPRATARPPDPRPDRDHQPHLSGGARYALGDPTRMPTTRQQGTS